MRILISNDDGVNAKGIEVLAKQLSFEHDITVVAPDKNRSGSSNALTLDRPLICQPLNNGFYSISGTPCDCVHLGTHQLMKEMPDMVVSGINQGANLADDVMYSGTVAGAMEGRHLGFPAVAISLASDKCEHYETAATVLLVIIKQLKKAQLSSNIILNINVPDVPFEQLKGYKLTRLGTRFRADTLVKSECPKGKAVYWIGPPSEPDDVSDGTDFAAIEQGFVSITPLLVDFTAVSSFKNVQDWIDQL